MHPFRIPILMLLASACGAAVTFTPIATTGADSEAYTGLYFRPDLGTAADVLPLKTRVWATRESVTGGIAYKALFSAGSTGRLAREYDALPAGSAGITFYAKASVPSVVVVNGAERSVGTAWTKVNYDWASLGTSSSAPAIGYQFVVTLKGPITADTWLILDRIGVESPTFDPAPTLATQPGPDTPFDGATMLAGQANLAPTAARLTTAQAMKVIAFGDSVTAGAQASRSTWAVGSADIPRFLYFAQVASLWSQWFADPNVSTLQFGHGGWTATDALGVVDAEVVANAAPGDVVIIEFGANDLMAGHTMAQITADLETLIAHVKTRTDQIIVMSPTVGDGFPGDPTAITAMLAQLVANDHVATADVTRFMLYRGLPFAYGLLSNNYHPDFMGHITLGELIAPVIGHPSPVWPPGSVLTPPDTTPPVISAPTSSSVTRTSAVVAWTTDEPSDSQIDWGTGAAYGATTALDATPVTTHRVTLSGLASGTTYHWRARSRDAAGNLAVGGDNAFATLSPYTRYLEAESGTLASPMRTTADATASGGVLISTSQKNKGTASYALSLPAAADYYVWGRVKAKSSTTDAFVVSVDGGTQDTWDAAQGAWSSAWQWARVNGRNGGAPGAVPVRVFHLSAGAHTLRIAGSDASVPLDRLFITDDPTVVPSDIPVGTG